MWEVSNIRHYNFCSSPPLFVTLRQPPLDSELGWTGGLWSKINFPKCQNSEYNSFFFLQTKKYFQYFQVFEEKNMILSDFFFFCHLFFCFFNGFFLEIFGLEKMSKLLRLPRDSCNNGTCYAGILNKIIIAICILLEH